MELAEAEQGARQEARRIQEEVRHQLQLRMLKEEEAIKEEFRLKQRERQERNSRQEKETDRQQRQALNALQSELQSELDSLKAAFAKRLQDSQRENLQLIAYGREELLGKVKSARLSHSAEMKSVQKDHEEKVQAMRAAHQEAKAKIFGTQSQTPLSKKSSSSNEEHDRQAASSNQRFASRDGDCDFLEPGHSPSTEDSGASADLASDEVDDDVAIIEAVAAEAKREVEKERDRQIQAEIRQLQTETVRLERQWKAKADEECRRIQAARDAEEKLLHQKQKQWTDEIAELVTDKEELLSESRQLSGRIEELNMEAARISGEVSHCDSELSHVKQRIEQAKREQVAMRSKKKEHIAKKRAELEKRLEIATKVYKQRVAENEACMTELHEKHEEELNRLDKEVKRDVARKEEQLEVLRDALQTEKVKLAKIEKLLKQYGSKPS